MPVPPIYQPEVAARAIAHVAEHPRRSTWVGLPTTLTIIGNRLAPSLLDLYLARTNVKAQQCPEKDPPADDANTWEPVYGAEVAAHGSFDDRAHAHSLQSWLSRHRRPVVLTSAVVGAMALRDVLRQASRYRCFMSIVRIDDVLTDVVRRRAMTSGIRLVSVDGPSGSGKSTLAERLAARSGAPLIEIDDFVSWPDFAGWWPRFESQVLLPLHAGSDAHYQVRDWKNDEFGSSLDGWKTVPWAPLVILEGVTCSRLAAADFLAFRIWVEAPADLRLKRGVERDGETHRQLWLDWMKEEARFFANDGTRARADLRINGNPSIPHSQASEIVTLD